MKLGVVGATGFIGSSLLRYFAAIGRPAFAFSRRLLPADSAADAVACHDLADPSCEDRLAGLDGVLFCTGSMLPADNVSADQLHSVAQEAALMEKCVRQTRELLFYVSSGGAVYGNAPDSPVAETAVCAPISIYGKYKLALEQHAADLCHRHGRRLVIARLSNPFGPLQTAAKGQGLIARLRHCQRTGEEFNLWGRGDAVRDYVHVDDFCRFTELVVDGQAAGIFNVGSGEGRTVLDILDLFARLRPDKTIRVCVTPSRQCDVSHIVLDITKAREQLGWRPGTELDDGLASLLAD